MPYELGNGLTKAARQIMRERYRRFSLNREIAGVRCGDENIVDWSFRFKAQPDWNSSSEIQTCIKVLSRKQVGTEERPYLLLEYYSCAGRCPARLYRCRRILK